MSELFQPWRLGALELVNRVVIAPMCQYSAEDGVANDWHMIHLGHLALSGAGLLITEATAVSAEIVSLTCLYSVSPQWRPQANISEGNCLTAGPAAPSVDGKPELGH